MYPISRGREFQAEVAAYENERFPNAFVLTCRFRRVRVSEECKLSWWKVHMKKVRKVNRGSLGEKVVTKC